MNYTNLQTYPNKYKVDFEELQETLRDVGIGLNISSGWKNMSSFMGKVELLVEKIEAQQME